MEVDVVDTASKISRIASCLHDIIEKEREIWSLLMTDVYLELPTLPLAVATVEDVAIPFFHAPTMFRKGVRPRGRDRLTVVVRPEGIEFLFENNVLFRVMSDHTKMGDLLRLAAVYKLNPDLFERITGALAPSSQAVVIAMKKLENIASLVASYLD